MIVALTLKLQLKEASERQTAQMKRMLEEQDATQTSMRQSLDNLS